MSFYVTEPQLSLNSLKEYLDVFSNEEVNGMILFLYLHEYEHEVTSLKLFQSYMEIIDSLDMLVLPPNQRNSHLDTEWIIMYPNGKGIIRLGHFKEALPGFVKSHPLELMQAGVLYQEKHKSEITDRHIVFSDAMINEICLKVFFHSKKIHIECPCFVSDTNSFSFSIKPILSDDLLCSAISEVEEFCSSIYDFYFNSISNNRLNSVEISNTVINEKIEYLCGIAEQTFEDDPHDREFSIVDVVYLQKLIKNLRILHDIIPNSSLISQTDNEWEYFGMYFPFQNKNIDQDGITPNDGPAHGTDCALQTLNIESKMKRLLFIRVDNTRVASKTHLFEMAKLLGSKQIATRNDSEGRQRGTRRLVPLILYYALTGGYSKLVQFIESLWSLNQEGTPTEKSAVLKLINPSFQKLLGAEKLEVYRTLPGYRVGVLSLIERIQPPWRSELEISLNHLL